MLFQLKQKQLKTWMPDFIKQLQTQHLILLQGPLGVGKTTFVQVLVECLSKPQASDPTTSPPKATSPVQSPTFTLHNTYSTNLYRVEHIDLYRHKNLDDIESTGLWDVFQQPCLVVVEWPERLPPHMWPHNWPRLQIHLSFTQEANTRQLKIT